MKKNKSKNKNRKNKQIIVDGTQFFSLHNPFLLPPLIQVGYWTQFTLVSGVEKSYSRGWRSFTLGTGEVVITGVEKSIVLVSLPNAMTSFLQSTATSAGRPRLTIITSTAAWVTCASDTTYSILLPFLRSHGITQSLKRNYIDTKLSLRHTNIFNPSPPPL